MVARLKELWFSIRAAKDIYQQPALGVLGLSYQIIAKRPSLYSLEPLARMLALHVTEAPQRPVRLGVVNLESGTFEANAPATVEDLRQGILASCSIPFFFAPVTPAWVDGGVRHIAPVSQAFDLANELMSAEPGRWDDLAIYLALASPLQSAPAPRDVWSRAPVLDIGKRSLELLEAENYEWDVRGAMRVNDLVGLFDAYPAVPRPEFLSKKRHGRLIVCEPEQAPYSTLSFDPQGLQAYWEHGRLKALAVLSVA
jgi:predicted acylesterase/phospholipase RssA